MARKRKARTIPRTWFIAAMGMVAVGTLSGYIAGGFLAPKPVACEPNPDAVGAMRSSDGTVQKYRMEDCEDGTKRMVPDGFIAMRPGSDGPVREQHEAEGPKTEL